MGQGVTAIWCFQEDGRLGGDAALRRSRARSRCNSRSMVATLMDHAERPSAATGLIPGGYPDTPPAAENAVTAVLAGRFLRPRPFRGLRGRMRTVFGCSPTSPIGLLASMAAPDAQRGERGAGGLLPAFSRSDGRKPVSSRLGQPDSAPRTAAGGRRWSSIRAAVILSEQQLAAV